MSVSKESKSTSSALAVLCSENKRHFIFEDKVVIGRSSTAFICITHSQVSRKHCVLEKTEDNRFTICDMSNFGTFVNGKKLPKNQPQELHHLDRIKLSGLDAYSYTFLVNKKRLGIKSPQRAKSCSPLTEKMIDLNETQSFEKDNVNKELDLVKTEMTRLKEELEQKLKTREAELEGERFNVSVELVYNKEQAEKAESMLKQMMEEKENVKKEYEYKIMDVTNKVKDLEKTKSEMESRHQTERKELEEKCKAEIEELKKKLEMSETKHQEFEDLQARLEETKNILLESELEQQRLFEAKVEVETKLESKIVDLTNERESKEEQVKELEKKLNELKKAEEKVKKEIEGLEDDMQCSICAELYIEPTALNCGHMFCKLCITQWTKKKNICPMCRAKISTTIRIFNMDSVIQRNVILMSEEVRAHREAVIAERKRGKTPQKKQPPKKRRREVPRNRDPSPEAQVLNVEALTYNYVLNVDDLPFRRNVRGEDVTVQAGEVPVRTRDGWDDPFLAGWISHPDPVRPGPVARESPVTVAAVDLTTPLNRLTAVYPNTNWGRTHTVTSADTTIDLTDG